PVQGRVGGAGRERGEGGCGGSGAVVDGDDVLAPLLPVDAGEGVDPGAVVGVELDLGARRERRGARAQLGELGDVRVEGRAGVVAVHRADGLAVERLLVLVLLYLAGEERLAGVLVPALADEALLVAVVDD